MNHKHVFYLVSNEINKVSVPGTKFYRYNFLLICSKCRVKQYSQNYPHRKFAEDAMKKYELYPVFPK